MRGELEVYRGISQFGSAYRIMMENDVHAPGSVDRELMHRMVRLCGETVDYLYGGYTPLNVEYERGMRPVLEVVASAMGDSAADDDGRMQSLADWCRALDEKETVDGEMQFGGTEEQIIARGSSWCTDVSRVEVTIAQVAGYPARLVHLFDLGHAYSAHVVAEVHWARGWGVIDPVNGIVYRHQCGDPASAWQLMQDRSLVAFHHSAGSAEEHVALFQAAAISNYLVRETGQYDYFISGMNAYYRAILKEAARGWPGGRRWLFGEGDRR